MIRAELLPAHAVVRAALFRADLSVRVAFWLAAWKRNGWKVAVIVALFCVASNMDYRDQLAREQARREAAEAISERSRAFAQVEPVTFVLEAGSFDEARGKWRAIELAAIAKQAQMMGAKAKQ